MSRRLPGVMMCVLAVGSTCMAADPTTWWNPRWRLRTTVSRPTPYRDATVRPAEVVVDFPLLLERAGVPGVFDPASLRVVEHGAGESAAPVPFACRTEINGIERREQTYLTWLARPRIGQCGAYDIYFDAKDRGIEPADYEADLLPPENLLVNPGFEDVAGGLPTGWQIEPPALVRLGRFAHTTGKQSLKIVVDQDTPAHVSREVRLSQKMDVRAFAGQEMVFECDLLAERATYGAPISIEIQQFSADGAAIPEFAVQPRWLTIELAQGQLVQFCERGRFNPEAATAELRVRVRCQVRDADSLEAVTGPEAYFTVWLDRFAVRPGERWPWPAASQAGFVAGATTNAPVNLAFEFTGQRRLMFNGASEGTLTSGVAGDAKSVHWGLEAGTLEFWCRPSWSAGHRVEHVLFEGVAYMHRLHSRLRMLGGKGSNQLEFTIADADAHAHTVREPAPLRAGQWHHIAATWDFPKAQINLFVDGRRVASEGPGATAWPSSLTPTGNTKFKGMGIGEEDQRSLPMQAFIGGDKECRKDRSAEAAMDEFRISDVVRYADAFTPSREELAVDEHTRALFRFEGEHHGVHDADDRFVFGNLFCEQPPQVENAVLDVLADGKIVRRDVVVKPHASEELFEANRAERRLVITRPFRALPDPRYVEYKERQAERVVTGANDQMEVQVGGDYEPCTGAVTFEHADGAATASQAPHWRAGGNVVPFSVKSIKETLAPRATTDEERAFEAFKYALQTTNYYDAHYCETLPKRHRPRVSYTFLKALNIYPFDQCGPLNFTLRKLFLAVGISSNDAPGTHHQFEQAFYRGSWRLFDLSPRLFWLNRDNATVVGHPGLDQDPYLKIRQGGDACAWLRGRKGRASFGTAERPHNMDFLIRPGERASLCWENEGRWFEVAEERKPIPLAKIPPYFGNGAIMYSPCAQGDAAQLDNVAIKTHAGGASELRAKDPAQAAALVYRARCPYIFSDLRITGRYKAKEAGAVALSLSFDDGKSWSPVWRSSEAAGEIAANPRDLVTARYVYWLKLELAADSRATVRDLKVRSTIVCSPLALPGRLSLGKNPITFVGGEVKAPMKTTCRWVERYRTDLGVSLNSISYYLNGDEAHRNLFVVAPNGDLPVEITLTGRRLSGTVSLAGLPAGWTVQPDKAPVTLGNPAATATARFVVGAKGSKAGDVHAFAAVVRGQGAERRVSAQALVGEPVLVREAERPDKVTGAAAATDQAEASGGKVMGFSGGGEIGFDLVAPQAGDYALWLRARWEPESKTDMTLTVDEAKPRKLHATAMIGFSDWTDPHAAHTKMFAHFGEAFGHWSWYRIPDVRLAAGKHRLTLGAEAGARFDALLLLPQNDVMDRAAMNMFQNWNFAPWESPL